MAGFVLCSTPEQSFICGNLDQACILWVQAFRASDLVTGSGRLFSLLTIDTTTYRTPNTSPRTEAIDALIVHSTEGLMPGCAEWLCNPKTKVSTHYIVAMSGIVYRLAPDTVVTWHAGVSALPNTPERTRYTAQLLVGQKIDPKPSVNGRSIGVELEHVQGGKPYTIAQRTALAELLNLLLGRYPARIFTHADVALPKGRKQDPTDWPNFYDWVADVTAPVPSLAYSEHSPILALPPISAASAAAVIAPHFPETTTDPNAYTRYDIESIVDSVWRVCQPVGVNPLAALAQTIHETAEFTSFWSQRPQRNAAGVGITGKWSPVEPPNKDGWKFNTQRQRWEVGISFKNWKHHSIPAHVGRLLAYVLKVGEETPEQRDLITKALTYRNLPASARGSAPTLRQLGKVHNLSGHGWAVPGAAYGVAIARKMNDLVRESL